MLEILDLEACNCGSLDTWYWNSGLQIRDSAALKPRNISLRLLRSRKITKFALYCIYYAISRTRLKSINQTLRRHQRTVKQSAWKAVGGIVYSHRTSKKWNITQNRNSFLFPTPLWSFLSLAIHTAFTHFADWPHRINNERMFVTNHRYFWKTLQIYSSWVYICVFCAWS